MNDIGASTTVMVVEPDILARMVIADYLRDCGYKIIEGVSAADVFTVLDAGTPVDVVFTEINLPGDTDGFALARRLREQHPGIEVVMASGAEKAARKAGDLCEEGPLEKPYHPQDVMRRIYLLREGRRTAAATAATTVMV